MVEGTAQRLDEQALTDAIAAALCAQEEATGDDGDAWWGRGTDFVAELAASAVAGLVRGQADALQAATERIDATVELLREAAQDINILPFLRALGAVAALGVGVPTEPEPTERCGFRDPLYGGVCVRLAGHPPLAGSQGHEFQARPGYVSGPTEGDPAVRSETEIRGDVMKRENLPPGKARAMARLRLADDAADLLARAVGAEAERDAALATVARVERLRDQYREAGQLTVATFIDAALHPTKAELAGSAALGLPADTTDPNR